MNPSVISALSALAGVAIGGLTFVVMSWLTQVMQARAQQSAHDKSRREGLYKEFTTRTYPPWSDFTPRSAGCGFCSQERSSNAPIKPSERLSTPIWGQTRVFPSCGR